MIRNFLFHRVHPQRDPLWDPMDPRLFERCIKHIAENYDVITAEDLLYINKSGRIKFATISFDDGYYDNLKYALPLLEKFKLHASFYVVTDCVNRNIPTWTYILDFLFSNTRVPELQLDFDFLPDTLRSASLRETTQRMQFARRLKPLLKKLSHDKRSLVLDQILHRFNDVELPKMMMSWQQLKDVAARGHRIGSHTLSHAMLGTIDKEQEIERELLESGKEIEARLGFFPDAISYPVGSYDERVIRLSEACGYKLGLTVQQRIYDPQKDGIFEIPRIELYNEPWWKTKLRISNSLENIKKMIGY